ncbi:uncharacterized protein EAF01_005010 [Botrytis porri]|uniref:Uncharacterized protein n=1 Tax=Botrytis porri TaxID=87229 RepID=A0A4Z1L6G2_9HELO|nr:uncharacterized protein EAF01_005010 [Botrytis porri]KAF7907424.1 hypothetical protein EAF01_005010 [Botrytis porri]TGO92422.1 hypothetical protein BPOR_0003g00200 [Botrytis porri]
MDQTPKPSQSPLDKATIDGEILKTSPATSSNHETQIATPTASIAATQRSSDKTKTSGKTMTPPPETPFSRNTESATQQTAPSLSTLSSLTSSHTTPLLPSPPDFFDSIAAVAPYTTTPHLGTYMHQFPTSSMRTRITRRCGRCITGCEFKTCSQRVSDDCIEKGHGSPTDASIFRPRLLDEHVRFPFPRMDNATSGIQATGHAVVDDESEAVCSYDNDTTIPIASGY